MRRTAPLLAIALLASAADAQRTPDFSSSETATANTKAALKRIKALNPRINAVIAVDPTAMDQARTLDRIRRARGPLFGMPILIKDNIESLGPLPTTAGSLALARNVTNRDAPLVARLRQAGAVIVGKANLSEWANIRDKDSISGWSAVGGQTRNPHALDRNACGSSSGSGSAVAAGMVPAAIGTETDGSITCPAAINGIVGFKPTVGLVSRTHIVPISHSQDTPGPMTRTVARRRSGPVRHRRKRPRRSADARGRCPPRRLCRGPRRRFAARQEDRGDALRQRLRHRRAVRGGAATLRAQGAILVEIAKFERRPEIGQERAQGAAHRAQGRSERLSGHDPAERRTRTLAEIIAFNQAMPARELALFGQDTFEEAEKTKGLDDPDYRKARET